MEELLLRSSGRSLAEWNAELATTDLNNEHDVRRWLGDQGVTGYAQMLVVYERFGYPDFFTKSADELVDAQYADRQALRPIYDAIIALLPELGETTVQTRKTYVSLLTPRRTFAVVAPVTRIRVDLGFRLADPPQSPRLSPAGSRLGNNASVKVGLTSLAEVDDEVRSWMHAAYAENL